MTRGTSFRPKGAVAEACDPYQYCAHPASPTGGMGGFDGGMGYGGGQMGYGSVQMMGMGLDMQGGPRFSGLGAMSVHQDFGARRRSGGGPMPRHCRRRCST